MSRRARILTADPGQLLGQAVQVHQTGQLDRAESLYRDVLRAVPEQPDALHLLGVLALQRGRPADAVLRIQKAVRRKPDSAIYHGNLGVALQAVGRLEEARASLERAATLDPAHLDAIFNLGVTLQSLGEREAAVACYRQALALQPAHVGALQNLGNCLCDLQRHEEAVDAYSRALELSPGLLGVLGGLGASLSALGQHEQAVAIFEAALEQCPSDPDAWLNLGVALHDSGQHEAAIEAYQGALRLRPEHYQSWQSLGRALLAAKRGDEAIACYQRALAILAGGEAAGAEVQCSILRDLAGALKVRERTTEAADAYRRIAEMTPHDPLAWRDLGSSLASSGALEEGVAALRRCVDLDPTDTDAHSKLIFALDLLPATTLAEAYAARRAWNERHAVPLATHIQPHRNLPDPERRLRVGYVSADFCRHSAASVFLAMIEAHDPSAVEVVCYAANPLEDDHTARFRAAAALWRPMADLADDALAEQIRADQIDVLVDLSAHSGGNRLLAFARKPAPVQVTGWGYATGTGLDTMDAFFADSVVVPREHQQWYAEQIVDLPSVVCYTPPPAPPPLLPLPALANGYVTFGSYNRPIKITPEVLETWARVLLAVPDSRLVLKPGRQDSPATRERLLGTLAAHGVTPERVELLGASPHEEHLATFSALDIQLDPFPHTGGVTTLEGLLMGVPCVTLTGERIPNRLSASFLSALGMTDLVARTTDEYVAIAVRLARDLQRLAREHDTLRQRLLASPIADARQYARAVEDAYRALWRQWCTRV